MRNTSSLAFVCFLAAAAASAQAEYELVWGEEFNAASIDATSWNCDTYHGVVRSANDAGFYTARPANVRVADGTLFIQARKESFDLAAFTTAHLQTYGKRAFTHGRVSVRMKVPAVAGLRPHVSLLPVELTYGSWPASGEIDIVNVNNGTLTSGLHFGGSGPRGKHVDNRDRQAANKVSGDGYHVYTMEWQPYEIRWYVDDSLVAVRNQWYAAAAPYPAPFDRPFYVALGLAVETPAATALENWPYTMQIDWIRVYQAKGNRAPQVKLTAPASNSTLPTAQRILLHAEASDADGNLAGVEFYNGDKRLAIDRDTPFTFEWRPTDGCYVVTARAIDEDGFVRADSTELTVGRGCPPTPFHDVASAIPGRIEAEDFDKSQRNEAYYDTDASNNGGAYRTESAVDIQPCNDGGFNLGWMIDDEWTRYTVTVAATRDYDVHLRVASPNDHARIRLEIDGKNITGSQTIPNTGDWQNFTDVVVRRVSLSAGKHVLRMVVEKEGLNLDYLEFIPGADD